MGTTDIVTGTLKGMGHVVECRLMVTHSELASDAGPAYVRCGVLEAPELPDGYYEAAFCGHTAFLHRANGFWNVGIPWREFGPNAAQSTAEPKDSSRSGKAVSGQRS
jgi:hypothetical protein